MPVKKILFFFFWSIQSFAQKPNSLPISNPEAQGVVSDSITHFLDAIAQTNHEFHSFMILRHGKIIAEGWWNPYRSDLKHTMYSVSKSFTATAVGFAVTEKKLSVDDKVISFFPNDLPDTVSPYLSELRVKDLLSMSVGMQPDPTAEIGSNYDNWVKAFLKTPIINEPGTKFLYNSMGSYMLSAIVQKVTGKKVFDYLKPRLFQPLGISGIDWEYSPQGINTGGWGLRLKTEDMAKFGQLFLQKGIWNGKQVLSKQWIAEASTKKIDQDPNAPQSRKDSSDWLQGYCYQMWRCRNNGFRADGAMGQFIIILPDKDAVIAITSETRNMQSEFNLVWKYIFPAFQSKKLPANPHALARLKSKSSSLMLTPGKGGHSDLESAVGGKTFNVDSGSFKGIRLDFKNGICNLTLKTDSAVHQISFGAGKWINGQTTKRGPYLVASIRGNRQGLTSYKVAGSYQWLDEKNLELTLRYTESPHTEIISCIFDGSDILVDFRNPFNEALKRTIYKGVMAESKVE